MDRFTLGPLLARGAAHTFVYRGTRNEDGLAVAMKQFEGALDNPQLRAKAEEERATMERIGSHPHILPLLDFFHHGRDLFLVTPLVAPGSKPLIDAEYCRGDYDTIIPPSLVEAIGYQVASALDHLHSTVLMLHRDIKPGNLLLLQQVEGEARVFLADFGTVGGGYEGSPWPRNPNGGELLYYPPQVDNGDEKEGPPTDCWALGLTLLALVTGHQATDDEEWKEELGSLDCKDGEPSDLFYERMEVKSQEAWDGLVTNKSPLCGVINGLLKSSVDTRLTAKEMMTKLAAPSVA